ncbi:hypothetical protein [Erythrobacter litoralis]|uniref:hypothetical protein n=1 Tax=Erythrobacter litoralis TaxID=39960 RepID=UPI000320F14A|nr:hypothetical protein [Erythrobacter litoralis]
MKLTGQFRPFSRHIRRYFHAYGGWSGVFGSPLFLVSVLIAAASYRQWLNPDWVDTIYALVPSLLGFSLGTYAILFSLITARVKGAMRAVKSDDDVSALEQVNATFFHFIFVQVIALVWAFGFDGSAFADLAAATKASLPAIGWGFVVLKLVGSFVGYTLLVYSITLVVGAALAIYRLALISDPGETGEQDQ